MTYTRSYWREFCGVLGKPLHHQPTQGGPEELAKHVDWYRRTLASYRRLLGCDPPGDLWPAAEERFADAARHRRVNLRNCWVIPKPRRPRPRMAMLALVGLAPLVGLANPFNLDGPHFLILYAILFVVASTLASLFQYVVRGSADGQRTEPLDAYEAACLAGGARQAIHAAAACLAQQGVIETQRQATKRRDWSNDWNRMD